MQILFTAVLNLILLVVCSYGDVDENHRLDCFPQPGASQEACTKRDCIWDTKTYPVSFFVLYSPTPSLANPENYLKKCKNALKIYLCYTWAKTSFILCHSGWQVVSCIKFPKIFK